MAVVMAAEDTGEDLLGGIVDFLVAEDPAAEDLVNILRSAARGATVHIEEALVEATVEVMLRHSIMEDTIILGDIMEATICTIIGDTPQAEQPSGFSLAEWLSEVYTVHTGGLITLCQCLRTIMTPIINIPILHLPM